MIANKIPRITKNRQRLIDGLSKYIDKEKATKDLYEIFKIKAVNWKTISMLVDCQEERWDLDNVLWCLAEHKKTPQASLFYNEEYIMKRHSTTKTHAKIIIKNYKLNKTTSLTGFIARHGELAGKEKFKKFQETSKSSSDKLKDRLIEQYGPEVGMEMISKEFKSRSMYSPEYYITRGMNPLDAAETAREYNIKSAGVSKQYYIDKGYDEDEIDIILEEINKKKKNHSRNRNFLKEKYGDSWIYHYKKTIKKYRDTMEGNGSWIPLEKLEGFREYKTLVDWWTRQTIFNEHIENIEKRSTKYHLDHMFSKKQGFLQNVLPKIIGSKYNLRIIPADENCKKSMNCSISLNTLLNLYYEN